MRKLFSLIIIIGSWCSVKAQDPVVADTLNYNQTNITISSDTTAVIVDDEIIEDIPPYFTESPEDEESVTMTLPDYEDWKVVTLSGKLKMRGLPLSPSLRIFMEKDSLVEISIKAPFMGEVGRIVLNPDSVVGINKMKKIYTTAPVKDFLRFYPGGITDFQQLLLGRVVLPGLGLIREEIIDDFDLYDTEDGIAVVVTDENQIEGFEYGYLVRKDFSPEYLLVIPEENPETMLTLYYTFDNAGYGLDVTYNDNSRQIDIQIDLKLPEWIGSALKPIELDKKYRYLSLGEFLRTF